MGKLSGMTAEELTTEVYQGYWQLTSLENKPQLSFEKFIFVEDVFSHLRLSYYNVS